MENLFIKVDATPNSVGFLRSVVGAFVAQVNPSMDTISDIKTAVSEAVTNVVVHAYNNKNVGEISVFAKLKDKTLHIEICDNGIGIADVDKALTEFYTSKSEEERSGLGFTIMQSFMDNLSVTSTPEKGTRVQMSKSLVS